jgi:hypothetical protein
MARRRRSPSKVICSSDSTCGTRSAAPAPWPTRAATSITGVTASPQASELAVKTATP